MKFSLLILAFALAAAIGIGGCGSSGDSTDSSTESTSGPTAETTGEKESTESSEPPLASKESEGESSEPVPKPDKKKPKVTVPKGISPNKFAIREIEEGTGPSAKPGDTVTIEYVGVGYTSEVEFDSSWNRKPYTFTIGSGEVVKGGERGVVGMKAGGRRELIVPAKLGYGAAGLPPTIGANETLIFVIDMLAIK